MGIKFSAMTKRDFSDLGGVIKVSYTKDSYDMLQNSLDSSSIFGEMDERGSDIISGKRDNMRAYIKLCKPVFNFVLGRSGLSLTAKILGIPAEDMKDVVNFEKVWPTWEEPYVLHKFSELLPGEDFLCGPELVKKWIDDFDIDAAIADCFRKIIIAAGGKAGCELDDFGELNKDHRGIPLMGGYYLDPTNNPDVMKGSNKIEGVTKYIEEEYLKSDETRLTFLINMSSKDNLYGAVQDSIVVIPPGMRPNLDKSRHVWTKAYARVIKASQELEIASMGEMSTDIFKIKYKKLNEAVYNLQYKTDPKNKKVYSILEKMKGKHGQIRALNLGKRQDYSGRSAVIINPFLSLNKIRIPKKMLPKLYRYHIMKCVNSDQAVNLLSQSKDDVCLKILQDNNILNTVPVILGRQPTLHKHGMQAFWAEPTDARAIEVTPLVCPAYNMDFDGDTGHVEVPLSQEAIKEVRDLILTTQNLYMPATGECAICPRQDMLYGLYMCTRSTYSVSSPKMSCSSYAEVRELVINHALKVYDTVNVSGEVELAGRIAFKSCFPKGMFGATPNKLDVVEINSKTIKRYVNSLLSKPNPVFIATIDSLVELGFKIARLYTASISLAKRLNSDTEKALAYDQALAKFHESMKEEDELYDLGLEDASTYNLEFDQHFAEMEESMKQGIADKLGQDSGYWIMADSGARGNTSNLVQMFAYKGRIKKNDMESFNAIIENSCVTQLTSLEHFMSAYGGRQGQIDKSLKTGDTGYAMRQLWHATSKYVITSDDCGTTEGITITKSDIAQFSEDEKEVDKIFKKIIVGRFQAKSSLYITESNADNMVKTMDKITIRSPLTCKNPCCRKCYGSDPSTNDDAVIGLPIGFIAAHSIGEPGTQLVMKEFQKGGVASAGGVASNFDRMNNYIHCTSLAKRSAQGRYPTYDPIAWEDGEVCEQSAGALHKRVFIKEFGSKRSVILPKDAVVKATAVKGEGLCLKRGDYDINEVQKYCGIERAQIYLVHVLYHIYKTERDICSKHFEVLVASMTQHMIIETDRKDLKPGQYYTTKELLSGPTDKTRYVTRLIGVKQLPLIASNALSNIIFEDISRGLSKAILLERDEPLDDPLPRMAMGLSPKAGTYYKNFMTERKRA